MRRGLKLGNFPFIDLGQDFSRTDLPDEEGTETVGFVASYSAATEPGRTDLPDEEGTETI